MKSQPQSNSIAEEPKDVAEQYSVVPTGQAVAGIYKALTYGERLEDGRVQVGKGSNYLITTEAEGSRSITLAITNSKKKEVKIRVRNIDALTGSNKGVKKLFTVILTKINEQAIVDGQLVQPYVTFTAKELVRLGIYTTLQSARVGFDRAVGALLDLQIGGTVAVKGKDLGIDILPLFTRAQRGEKDAETGKLKHRGLCRVKLNTDLNWAFMVPCLTVIPNFIYQLSNKGTDLQRWISSQARQKQNLCKIVREGKPFTVSFSTIQRELCLPQVGETGHPDRDIRQALGDAIEEVATQGKLFTRGELIIRAKHKDGLNLKACSLEEYLAGGYIEVSIKGSLLEGLKKVGGARRLSKKPKDNASQPAIAAEPPKDVSQQEGLYPLPG